LEKKDHHSLAVVSVVLTVALLIVSLASDPYVVAPKPIFWRHNAAEADVFAVVPLAEEWTEVTSSALVNEPGR
jgi:hypothetical protein